ncbi:acyltransferase [Mycobacterium sp. ITM-2016-00317]|uniref:acyltransferase family protein n=1 Tax=Mycobacterium sp. ITM-2016-00317 TaxID=2099694 RepID=UPI00287F90FF|nr:acyltransferase [Mycobacterium sp. ITM-2016-00317]WNG88942.1 acyltransferase [Mycobacterium sp. ITM-2016-00317]
MRLDIQGLRAVAVLAVFAHHLWGVPVGGFVGIDVFFVITGFFVTESLLRAAADDGAPSLRSYYWDRIRRIAPSATLVLVATVVAAVYVLPPPAARDIGTDALYAFFFVANWHSAVTGTDVLTAADTASPLLHYWPLSIEEQFLVLWPLVLVGITAAAVRSAWSHERWLARIAAATGLLVVASFAWALYATSAFPTWAVVDTAARAWELGVGALLATATGALTRLPEWVRPLLSWAGVGLIGVSMIALNGSAGFPAPWALLPVTGTVLVIAAGVGSEPALQGFLRNRAITYVGDLSYALYLAHWPVIVLLAAMMEPGVYYYASVLTLTFGLAVAVHHLVENPLRYASVDAWRQAREDMRHGLYHAELRTKIAAVAALVLITLSVISYAMRPDALESPPAPPPADVGSLSP